MNPVDAVAAALVALGAALGARRGLISQVARLLALAGGLAGARMILPETAALVRRVVPGLVPPLDRYVAFLGTFLAGAALVLSAAAWLEERVKEGPLAPLDRAGGALVGGAKGVLLCYVGLFALICAPAKPLAREVRGSRVAPVLLGAVGIKVAGGMFPDEFEARGKEVRRDIAVAKARERIRKANDDVLPCATVGAPGKPDH